MRQAFGRGFYVGGALAGAMTATKGRFPPGDAHTERDAAQSLISTDRAKSYPAPDGQLTFDKLSSVFASGNRTRDDQPNHIRVADEGAARAGGRVGAHVPRAGLRSRRRRRRGHGRSEAGPVELRPVRRDHRQRRPPNPPRRRQRPRVHTHVTPTERARHGGCRRTCPGGTGSSQKSRNSSTAFSSVRPKSSRSSSRRTESQRTPARSSPRSSSTRALRVAPVCPHVVGSGRRTARVHERAVVAQPAVPVALAEQVVDAAVFSVEPDGIRGVQLAHSFGEPALVRLA